MKKYLMIAVALLTLGGTASAADRDGRVQIGAGLLYPNGIEATVGYEKEFANHNAMEVFASGYLKWADCATCGHICQQSFWKNYNTWEVGVAYKPCVYRAKNNYGSLRIGGSVGSDTHNVIGGVHAGYEHSYVMRGGWQLFWQTKTEFVINGQNWFKTGVGFGVKF